MAIVKTNSDLIKDPYDINSVAPDPQQARGRLIIATGTVANAADDSNGSSFPLLDLPADCIPHHDTFFEVTSDGFAQIVIGTDTDTDALIDQARATENVITPFAQGGANHGRRLWEILGYAANPGGHIRLVKHAEANASAAGSTKFQFAYLMP